MAYGLDPNRESFERALEALRAADFRNSDISAILPDRDHTTKDLAHEINTKTPEGIAAGAAGGLIGAGIPEVEAKRYAGRIREGVGAGQVKALYLPSHLLIRPTCHRPAYQPTCPPAWWGHIL